MLPASLHLTLSFDFHNCLLSPLFSFLHPAPPPPPPPQVQLRFHCQGQVCCRQLRQAAAAAQHAAKAAKPLLEAVSRQFSQTHLSFCIKPPDFAKECSTNNSLPQVSRKCVQTPTHQAEHISQTRFLIKVFQLEQLLRRSDIFWNN